jgi:hypothetical protein
MEPDRFDDVEFRYLERPEPPPRGPRRRRLAAVLLTAAVMTGGITAGASALSDSGSRPAAPAKATKPKTFYNADGVPTVRDGHECWGGKGEKRRGHRDRSESSVRY